LRSFFFCLRMARSAVGWARFSDRLAEADHPVGWTKKRLKSDLEPLNLTSQVHEVTSSVYEPATSVHLVTSKHDNLISFALEHESMNNNKK